MNKDKISKNQIGKKKIFFKLKFNFWYTGAGKTNPSMKKMSYPFRRKDLVIDTTAWHWKEKFVW